MKRNYKIIKSLEKVGRMYMEVSLEYFSTLANTGFSIDRFLVVDDVVEPFSIQLLIAMN